MLTLGLSGGEKFFACPALIVQWSFVLNKKEYPTLTITGACQKLNFCPILPHDRRPHGIQQFSLVCAAIYGHFSNRTHGFACDQPIESCPCQDPFEYKVGLQYSFSRPFSKLNNKFFTLFRFLLLQFFRFVSLTLKKI